MSNFDFTASARRVTAYARKADGIERDYAGLAEHFGLTPDTDSKVMTAAARAVVLAAAHADGTETGAALVESDLAGKDPGKGKRTWTYWNAARTVRAGLVKAAGTSAKSDPDWIRLVRQAVENAHVKGEVSVETVLDAVRDSLGLDS